MTAILRPLDGPLEIMMPYLGPPITANRRWLKTAVPKKSIHVTWDSSRKVWLVSRAHFPAMIDALRQQFGTIDVFEDHSDTVICNTSCQDAEGIICNCRCLGENHGIANYGRGYDYERESWVRIGDEVLVQSRGVIRSHFKISPKDFRPISEWTKLGYEQYVYGHKHPKIIGNCFICRTEESALVLDHCHEHGWIRDRICSPCNGRLGFIEKTERPVNFGTVNSYSTDIIEQFTLCPDCSEIYFEIPPPHMRPNWRPGYFNESERFQIGLFTSIAEVEAKFMRYRHRFVSEYLSQFSGESSAA